MKAVGLSTGRDGHWLRALTTADQILVICLITAVIGTFIWQVRAEQGGRVLVRSVGDEQSYPLSVEHSLRVVGPLGESLVEIAGGKVRIAASPCRHQVCVRRGWIDRRGDVSVCLPNELVLVIEGAVAVTGLDAVVR